MKYLFLIAALLFNLPLQAAELSPQSKLALAEGAVALVVGAPALLGAIAIGKTEQLCWVLEGDKKPSSYNPNPDGKDQCPNGNWLRIIPFLKQS
jgi:hypothetical protein